MPSIRRTSNNYYDDQIDDLSDTEDVTSFEQSDGVSTESETAANTDVTSSPDESYQDSSSTDYSLSMDDAPHSTSLSSNCSDSLNSPEDSHEEIQPRFDQWNSQDHRDFRWDSLEGVRNDSLCIECKVHRFIKVQRKVKCLRQLRRSISEIIKIMNKLHPVPRFMESMYILLD